MDSEKSNETFFQQLMDKLTSNNLTVLNSERRIIEQLSHLGSNLDDRLAEIELGLDNIQLTLSKLNHEDGQAAKVGG